MYEENVDTMYKHYRSVFPSISDVAISILVLSNVINKQNNLGR